VGGLLALLFLLRSFVADVYRVESGSMAPFLHGGEAWGEWVLVSYGRPDDLERFDLVVTYEGSGKPVVKRVVGLPGETVQVRDGDLFVEGKRLPPEWARPAPIALYDVLVHGSLEEHFEWEPRYGSFDAEALAWELDTVGEPESSEGHLLRWRASGGENGRAGAIRLELRERGDLFRATLSVGGEPADGALAVPARIERLHPDHGVELLAEGVLAMRPGEPFPLTFANVDNFLVLSAKGGEPLVARYAENREPADLRVTPGVTVGTQVALGGDDLRARFRRIHVTRDLHWIPRGDFAVDRPLSLGPDEVFLLGDSSANSLDGRAYGATRIDAILGRPVSVLWPRSRARSLRDGLWRPVPGSPEN
jgi:signal peptidase I